MKVIVIGAQWGDEGKGKIVDFLAENATITMRYSGGANAGHTIVISENTYKLHLIPSGIVLPNKKAVLGNSMVIDFTALFEELATLEEQGITWSGRVFISDRAHIVLPGYKDMDKEHDKNRKNPIGTTGRGIGIAYAQKALRDGIRIRDIFDESVWNRLDSASQEFLTPYKEKIKPMVVDLASFMWEHRNENILFEGAQGTLLDTDLGTYPYVSSGMSCAAGAAIGGSIGMKAFDHILGVYKAYSTRVGNGPFPTEFNKEHESELDHYIRETGREFGVTTGRPRRCGYLDLVSLRYACITNSLDSLALTHLDVYDEMDEIKLCIAYDIEGKKTDVFPSSIEALEKAKPVLKTFKGWKKSLKNCKTLKDLPKEAKTYIDFIEEYTGTPNSIISVGFQRTETIVRTDPWKKSSS
jgi:adenylosuccinate synthase